MWCSVAIGVLLTSITPVAEAGRRKRPVVIEEPVTPMTEEAAPSFPVIDPLWPGPLPRDVGPLPSELANGTAQGCGACHHDAFANWQQDAHAGRPSLAFERAAAEANTPACLGCHFPLAVQHTDLIAYDGGDRAHPVATPNPAWSPTLQTEGVTCIACHLRNGTLASPHPDKPAPHPLGSSAELAGAAACAPCHQLMWTGADQPLYDTIGEWNRSAWAKADVTCQDCHLGPGADQRAVSHDFAADPARAFSLLVEMKHPDLKRGGAPLDLTVRVQNTGAGHSYPTGSPFRFVRIRVTLVGPDIDNTPTRFPVGTAELRRELQAEPPWNTINDTRLEAGEERQWSFSAALPFEAPPGEWHLRVSMHEVIVDKETESAIFQREIPLRVD